MGRKLTIYLDTEQRQAVSEGKPVNVGVCDCLGYSLEIEIVHERESGDNEQASCEETEGQ